MKLEMVSREAQNGLRLWANDAHGDELLFDDNASAPEFWSWICYQLWASQDRPEWFPKGKSATIQAIQSRLLEEALNSLPAGVRKQAP
jgi:hypothetical protein